MNSNYRTLGKNTMIFALGTFGSKAIVFLMLPVFTRVLTQADYGKIDIITTSISLLLPLVTLNIVEAVFRFTLDKGTMEQKQAIFSSALTIGTAGFLFLLLFIPVFIHFGVSGSLLAAFLILFYLDIIHGVTKVLVRAEQKLKLFAMSDIIHTAVFASMGILLVAILRLGVIGYLLSQIIAVTVSTVVLFLFGSVGKYVIVSAVRVMQIKEMARYSLPLVPNALAWWIMSASDRYMLAFFLGFSSTGIYAVAHKFPMLLSILNTVFYQAWQISSIDQYNSPERQTFYSNTFRILYTFMFLGTILFSIVLKPFVTLMTGTGFQESWRFVPFLILGTVFHSFSQFFGVGYLAAKKTGGAFRTSGIGAAANIGVNLLLIPIIGIQAASISTAIAFFVMWIARLIETRKYFTVTINWTRLSLGITLVVVSLMMAYFGITGTVIQSICLLSFLILEKRTLKAMLKKLLTVLTGKRRRKDLR
ncbi:putative Wzx [Mesotoga infera]|uniref:Putative Wzx n=1 Tax=Mesotoga infera TaxID=1236046 RepID=A0A7Z7LDT9_9BACT|nr:polysaccharide biosynthesis C-terminal domain-containing protein [Mesotoga infera]SSC12133.1 putative Wzx [Mesotoga infera]